MKPSQRMRKIDRCKICGEEAIYAYFGVIACQACKMFFKRYAENKQKTLKCFFSNDCEIEIANRHVCAACRLRKCFQSGMQVSMIRHYSTLKQNRKSSVTDISLKALLPRNNLLQSDTSLLTTDQWTLLTNLSNLYDLSKIFDLAHALGPSSSNTDPALINPLLHAFYDEAGQACRRNADFQALSFSDRSTLLPTAIDNITCLVGIYICAQTKLVDHRGYVDHIKAVYGPVTINSHRWATTFVNCDSVTFKLALALFSLCNSSRTLQRNLHEEYGDVKTILEIENRYVEIIWKYLLYKYGFKEAVQRYVQLIRWLLAMSVFMYFAHCSTTHIHDLDSLVEETELKLIIEIFDDQSETNKTEG